MNSQISLLKYSTFVFTADTFMFDIYRLFIHFFNSLSMNFQSSAGATPGSAKRMTFPSELRMNLAKFQGICLAVPVLGSYSSLLFLR